MCKKQDITHNYTKHYYAGSERILSKVGGGGLSDIDADPHEEYNIQGEYGTVLTEKQKVARTEYEMAWECLGTLNPVCKGNSLTGNVYNVTQEQTCPFFKNLYEMKAVIAPENDLYFYHSDHLGSASWITSTYGQAIQHLLYLPFGETMVDQRTTSWSSRYSFSAKEKDEESGYSYFGARYYDSDISIWLSVDPLASNSPHSSPYVYCNNNPIRLIDPNGEDWYEAEDGTKQFDPNITKDSKLKAGEKYLGATHSEKGANYRSDGSIMYSKESDAYSRMVSQSERTGNESMAALTDAGTLVLPDYKNTSSSVDIADYGYSAKNGNVVDAFGATHNTFGTAHTHPGGTGPSDYTGYGYGDMGFAAGSTPFKPVFVLQMGKDKVSGVISTGKQTEFSIFEVKGASISGLQKGTQSLTNYAKSATNAFRQQMNKP